MTRLEIPKDIEPFLVGIWRFRGVGQPKLWFATFTYRGSYYDVYGCQNPNETCKKIRAALQRLRRPHRKI
jgi:hypothetical protein